jgi:hypothetical protein
MKNAQGALAFPRFRLSQKTVAAFFAAAALAQVAALTPETVYAQSPAPTTNGETTNSSTSTGGLSAPAQTIAVPTNPSQQGNLNGNSKSASNTNMIGMALNGGMAAAWFGMSFGPSGPCSSPGNGVMMCMFSAMSLAQLASDLGGQTGSNGSAAASQYQGNPYGSGGGGTNGGTTTPPVSPGINNGQGPNGPGLNSGTPATGAFGPTQKAAADKLAAQLAAAGYTVSPNGTSITTPQGQTVPTSSLGSNAGLNALGFSDDQIAAATAAGAKAADKLKKDLGLDDGGGGGGGGGGSGGNTRSTASASGPNFSSLFGKDKKAVGPKSMAGMTKQLANDRIGAAGDDIFQMISRQYIKRDQGNEFLK